MPALKEIKQAIDESVERLRVDLGRQIDGGDALTRAELRQEIAQSETHTRTELRGEMAQMRSALRGEMAGLHRHFDVVMESVRGDIQLLAGVVGSMVPRLEFDDFRREVKVEFADIRALLQASHGDLDRRVTRLEKGR